MTELVDQPARDRAWQCFDRNLDVAAGAGTGKTRVLVDRYLAWILGEGWARGEGPRRAAGSIVAITFTEKAAGEMGERIVGSLRTMMGEPGLAGAREQEHVARLGAGIRARYDLSQEELLRRVSSILDISHRLEVSTIHSFAARVLRAYPLEAGVCPSFSVDAGGGLRRKALRRAFVDATWAGLRGAGAAAYAEVLGRVSQVELLVFLERLLDSDLAEGRLAPAPDLLAAASRCRLLAATLGRALPRVPGRARVRLERVRAALRDAADDLARDPAAAVLDPRRTLDPAPLRTLREDLRDFPPETVARALGWELAPFVREADAVRRICVEILDADPALIQRILALYGPVVATVRSELLSAGLLSYDDLLRLAERLLAGRPDVARALSARYEQILVDELQDTSRAQCRILEAIALSDLPEYAATRQVRAGADGTGGHPPGPGRTRLFLVGDPKQSIYAFRQADLAAYEAFSGRMDERLVLTASFRSQAHLVEVTNAAFERLFSARPGLQPPAEPLVPVRPPLEGAPAVRILDAGSVDGRRTSAEARKVEAQTMVALIGAMGSSYTGSGPRWARFAILSRVQSEAATTVDALEGAGIPCVVSGDKEFYRRQEVLDAANLLRVLIDPSDAVAWIGVLRSPLGAVPDRVLVDLTEAGFFSGACPADALEAAAHAAPDGRAAHILRVRHLTETLLSLGELLHDGPVDLWLAELLERLPIVELYAASYLGERKVANVLRVLHSFAEAAVAGTVPLREWLDEVVENLTGQHEESESALADETTDAVRVMSIHASKGLQFDHVFVPRLDFVHGPGDRREARVDERQDGSGFVVRVAGATSWGTGALRESMERIEEAEAVRLLYVACTRAKESTTLLGRLGSARGKLVELVRTGFLPLVDGDRVVLCRADGEPEPPIEAVDPARHVPGGLLCRAWGPPAPVDEPRVPREVDEAAVAFGSAVHALLERWDGGELHTSDVDPDVADLLRGFLASPLAARVRAARTVLRELPWISPAGVGTIDLLIEEERGWVVVDYKTDRVAGDLHAQRLAARYREQGRRYVEAVEGAMALSGVRFELWFLRPSGCIAVEVRS